MKRHIQIKLLSLIGGGSLIATALTIKTLPIFLLLYTIGFIIATTGIGISYIERELEKGKRGRTK